jgi:hypothetical protein
MSNSKQSNMDKRFFMLSLLFLTLFSCSIQKKEMQNNTVQKEVIKKVSEATKDSLIAELANMETDTLDCSAKVYWQIVGTGKSYIPNLIKHLTDTTSTNIFHGCKNEKLNLGELSYFALEEIIDFPTYLVTQIQFDTFILKDGWSCWSFYDYLFEGTDNKKDYQDKVKSFYEKSKFEFVVYPDSLISKCMEKYSISGKYRWKN